MVRVSAMGATAAHRGVSASPGREIEVVGQCGAWRRWDGALQPRRLRDGLSPGAARSPHQTFSPGTRVGAEPRVGLTSPKPQIREKTIQKFPRETLLMAHQREDQARGSRAEPVPPQQQLETGFPGAESHLAPDKGGNHSEKQFRCCPRSCPEATALPWAALGCRAAFPSLGTLWGQKAQPLGRGLRRYGEER